MLKSIALSLVFTVTSTLCLQNNAHAMLVPANQVEAAPSVDRETDLKTIQTTLESKVLRAKLHAMGLSDAEIDSRVSKLSDTQVHQLASQIRAVHPAGGLIIGLLVLVVLVLLIIYLIKRI